MCQYELKTCNEKIEKYKEVRDWISDQEPEAIHYNIRFNSHLDRYPNCGKWVWDTDKFNNWSNGAAEFLWIKGPGKYYNISTMIVFVDVGSWNWENNLDHNRRLAYYYCSKDETSRNQYQNVLRALLVQAAYDPVSGTISQSVVYAFNENKKFLSFRKCKELIAGVLKDVKLRIMIDALDECDDPKELLKVLRNLAEIAPGRLELLVSSRHSIHVRERLDRVVEVDVQQLMPKAEMLTYIETEIKERKTDERLLKGKRPDLEDRLIVILNERANGMFRWVELQLSFFLKPKASVLRPETVEDYLNKLNKKTLTGEEELYAIYDAIFNLNSLNNSLERKHAMKIHQILIRSLVPVTMDMLVQAVTFDEVNCRDIDDVQPDYILQLTQDFMIETLRKTLELAHVSAMEYLQQCRDLDNSYHPHIATSKVETQVVDARIWNLVEIASEILPTQDQRDIELQTSEGQSLLHLAAQYNRVEIIELLRSKRADLEVEWMDETTLEVGVDSHSPDAARQLLNGGADPNHHTPLAIATVQRQKDLGPLLLSHGADPNCIDDSGFTPLALAQLISDWGIESLLLANGARPEKAAFAYVEI
ncbi:uncharacterized protein Z519_05476 [Cladophialophora bantiana CBS 173.52]|uniref:Nephrocystin 3-like N-terminal domain-containing protein n=1 Tax=Cladophialophora bantiana (strain ATCC 10958 / CBS 173.52 / CDC B-1940 / NIH 8579) TaxID=1442370 RepID=A0A0D2HTI8_CLAB1|nr:uncharacterized protein Z519_05476 [Cladophialophora bantiana CBS 173.52]KIW94160.1 hypothetical protein Z519_05476 [Cladophialophora bantiana CBS 173.52]